MDGPGAPKSTAAPDLAAALFIHSPDALLLTDPLTERVLDANPEAQQLTDLGRDDLLHVSVRSLVRHEQEWQDWLIPGAETGPREGFLLRARPPRPWVPVGLWLRRVHGPAGEALVLIGLRDRREAIDARRRAQRADAELRRALASACNALFCCQAERVPADGGGWRWQYRYLSPAAERITGRALSHLLEAPLNWQQAVAPDDRPSWAAFRARLLEGRGGELSYHILKPDGTQIRAREQATVAPGEGGWVIHGAVTELPNLPAFEGPSRSALQGALEHRIEGVTTMAAGVAHDLNNLVMGALGQVSLARLAGTEGAAQAALDEIELLALRTAELGQQLSILGGRARPAGRPEDINRLVREALDRVGSPLPTGARFEPGELPPVSVEADLLRQALERLLRHAGSAGGRAEVTIRTYQLASVPSHEEGLWLPKTPPPGAGPWAAVEVRDRSPGLAPEMLPHVFDPFAPAGSHERGPGLSLVWAAARAHGGLVHARSAPGEGTCVRLLLPAPTGPLPPKAPSAQGLTQRPVGEPSPLAGATVLLADDEEAVRDVVARLLTPLGCRVLQARDGEEAVACFRDNAGASVVLLDLSMPRLSGEATLRELRRLAPQVPIILMSGLPPDEVLAQSGDAQLAGYLQKPFRLPALLEALSRALAGNQREG